MAEKKIINTELQPIDKLLDSSGDAGTSGQILSSTGSGTNWITSSSGTITGSGSQNYIPLWSSGTVLTNSIISSSGGDVTINGSDDDPYIYINPSGGNIGDTARVQFNSRGWVGYIGGFVELGDAGQSKDIRLRVNTAQIFFQTSNTTRMTISTAGNVGIGTQSPSTKLHVYNGEATIASSTDGVKLSYSGGNSSGVIDTAFSDNALEFRTNGSSKMFITNAGLVGIGTTSPTGVLDVLSTDAQRYARFRAPNGEERFEFHIGSTGNGARLSMFDHDGTTEGVRLSASGNSYLNNSSKLGINTASPQEVLSVTGGNIALDNGGDYILGGATTSAIIGRLKNTSGVYTLDGEGTRNIRLGSSTNGEVVRIDNTNSRVGIGTIAPNEVLEVAGNIRASGSYKVGATEVISSGRRFFAADGTNAAPAYSFSARTDTGMYVDDHGSNDRIFFSVDGTARAYIDANGISSNATIYVSSAGSFRNYSGVWKATTGTTGNGFQFFNTADNSSAVLLSITSVASAATDSLATFSGKARSQPTVSGDDAATLATKGYVDGLVTGVTRYMGLWDPSSGTGGSPDLTASTYKVPGYYFIVSADGTATPNGAGTEPNTWHVGDWVIWSDQATDAWQKIDNTSVISGVGASGRVTIWNGDESLSSDSAFTYDTATDKLTINSGSNTSGLEIGGANSRIYFSGYRALEGQTNGVNLYIGETFTNVSIPSDTNFSVGTGTSNFAGSIIVDGNGSSSVLLKTKGSARIALENANATDSFYLNNTGGNGASVLDLGGALSLVENGNATFTGDITVTGGDITIGTDSVAGNINSVGDVMAFDVDSNTGGGSASMQWKIANSEKMRLNTTGLGIGTNDPAFNLEVFSATNSTTAIGIGNSGTAPSRLYIDASNGDFSGSDYMWIGQDNDLSGEIFMAQNAGSFKIKTQPSGVSTTQFEIAQNGNATFTGNIILDDGSGASPTITFRNGADEEWYLSENSSGKLIFQQSTTERGEWSSSGLVIKNGALSITGDGSNAATLEEHHDGAFDITTVGDFTIDAAGDINLDADGGDIRFKDGGTIIGAFANSSSNFVIKAGQSDKDIFFQGVDGGSNITALTLDMSSGGTATFNNELYIPNYIYHVGDGDTYFGFPTANEFKLVVGGTNIIAADANSAYLYYQGSAKLQTTSTGISVTGDIADRDIPCLFNSNWLDGTSSSIYLVPFNNHDSEKTVSARTYYNNLTMPSAGKVAKVVMKNVSGSPSSSFTTQLFLYVNGSQVASSSELTIASDKITWSPTSSNTFSAGDELSFGYQKSASNKTWSGVSMGIIVELTDYDI